MKRNKARDPTSYTSKLDIESPAAHQAQFYWTHVHEATVLFK